MTALAAGMLHPHDALHVRDWTLHVTHVDAEVTCVAVFVEELAFPLHYPTDQLLQVDLWSAP